MLESYLNRTKYIMGDTSKGSVVDFFARTFCGSDLVQDITDLFVVRDSISHNHVWEQWPDVNEDGVKLLQASLVQGYGDRKFRARVDMAKGRNCGLEPIPVGWRVG